MTRGINFFLGILLGSALFSPLLIIALIVRATSSGPIIFWSSRVGKNNRVFQMPKFRTMRIDAPPDTATHLLETPEQHLTLVGGLLRKTSLDELPQIWSVIKGDMALVGPRPALYNQNDLISMRTKAGIQNLPPGITGWAQILGRDQLPVAEKVKLDEFYLKNRSFFLDLKILLLTLGAVFKWEQVSH
ncbi:MAG: sugar transferase [Nitrospinae bacterium]|nr:sugar transferase [Nitrospinota bacterium]